MKNQLLLLFALCVSVFSTVQAQAQSKGDEHAPSRRVALVIGNSDYKFFPLANPENDAFGMSRALSDAPVSFEEVLDGVNLTQKKMREMILSFGQKLNKDSAGLFYYAGHAVQIKGKNYLIPTDAVINVEADIEKQGIDVTFVLAQMRRAGSRINVIILDACRSNPFADRLQAAARDGLAEIDAPSGTFIAYATGIGKVASDGKEGNGLYTKELLANITVTPRLKLEEVFKRVARGVREKSQDKQIPWVLNSLESDFFFITDQWDESFTRLYQDIPIAQVDLSGTYDGNLNFPKKGLSGPGSLTITGNSFSLTLDSGQTLTGRLVTVSVCGFTGVNMLLNAFPEAPAESQAMGELLSLEVRKVGDNLTLQRT